MTVLFVSPMDLKVPQGSATNEQETIGCLHEDFRVVVVSFRYIRFKERDEDALTALKICKHIEIPTIYKWGLHLMQVLLFATALALAFPVMKRMFRLDVVFVRDPIACAVLIPIARLLRIPLIYRVLSVAHLAQEPGVKPVEVPLVRRFLRGTELLALLKSNLVLTATKRVANSIPRDEVFVVPFTVDESFYNSSTTTEPRSGSTFVVGYAGAFSAWYDFRPFFSILKNLREQIPGLTARLYGMGENRIQQMAKEMGVADCVVVNPAVPRAQMPSVLRSFDVLLVPLADRVPGLPIKVFEAFAAGVPVILTSGIEREPFKDGVNCLIVPNRPHFLSKAILRIARDADLRQKLIQGGVQLVHSNKRCVVSKEYARVVKSLVHKRNSYEIDMSTCPILSSGQPSE